MWLFYEFILRSSITSRGLRMATLSAQATCSRASLAYCSRPLCNCALGWHAQCLNFLQQCFEWLAILVRLGSLVGSMSCLGASCRAKVNASRIEHSERDCASAAIPQTYFPQPCHLARTSNSDLASSSNVRTCSTCILACCAIAHLFGIPTVLVSLTVL